MLALIATLPLTFFLAVAMPQRERITASISVTILMIVWIGLGVAHAALLRGLDHGGSLVLMVLLGTFFGDTFAYFGGRLLGRHKMSPTISPNKTWEGLACGIVLGTLVVWYAAQTYADEHWISGTDGLLLGLAVVIAAPIGDLFESLIKRDMGVKDTGTLFGAHGGALDRVDAALFALVAGYYVWLAVADERGGEARPADAWSCSTSSASRCPACRSCSAFLLTVPFAAGLRAGHLDPADPVLRARCWPPPRRRSA